MSPPPTAATARPAALPDRDADRRRAFARKLALRRGAYRDATAFRTFPLQAPAVAHFSEQEQRRRRMRSDGDGATPDPDGTPDDATRASGERDLQRREVSDFAPVPVSVPAAAGVSGRGKENDSKRAEDGAPAAADGRDAPAASVANAEGRRAESDASASATDGGDTPRDDAEEQARALSVATAGTREDRAATGGPPAPRAPAGRATPPSENEEDDAGGSSALWSREPRLFAMETALKGKRR